MVVQMQRDGYANRHPVTDKSYRDIVVNVNTSSGQPIDSTCRFRYVLNELYCALMPDATMRLIRPTIESQFIELSHTLEAG